MNPQITRLASFRAVPLAACMAVSSVGYSKESAENVAPYDFTMGAAAQSAQYVDLARGDKFSKIKKLGIVNFSVEFALYKSAWAAGGSSQSTYDVSKSVEKVLPAPDVNELQGIVDRLYTRVVEEFKAQGVEVVPFETLKATKNYEKLAPAQHDSPWLTNTKDTQSVFMAPTGMKLYFDNPGRADLLKGLGFTFGTNTRMKEVMMVYDLGQEVNLLSVNMVVDFATVKGSGNTFSSYGAKVSGSDVHHLHAADTSFRFVSNTQPEFIVARLKKPLVSDLSLWSNVAQTTTRDTVLTTGGGLAARKTTVADGEFDMPLYYARSEAMMSEAARMFIHQLANAK
jgi:hypothetical protein